MVPVCLSVCVCVCVTVSLHAGHLVLSRNTTIAPGCKPHDLGRGWGRGEAWELEGQWQRWGRKYYKLLTWRH